MVLESPTTRLENKQQLGPVSQDSLQMRIIKKQSQWLTSGELRHRGSASDLQKGDIVLLLSNLPTFVWIAAALLPLGATAYALKFYRKHCGYLIVWTRVAALALVQIAVFLLSFAFF